MLISYQRGPRNNRRKGQVSAVRGAGGPLSGQGTDMPGRGDQHSPTAAAMFPGRQKMQLVLIKHAMVDSVPRVQDLSHLQDPGIQVLIAGWHTTSTVISPFYSLTVSAAATSSVRGFPGGPVVCLWAGALLCPARIAHLRDSTTATLRMREGGEAANQG